MVEGQQDDGGANLEAVGVGRHRRGHDQWRGKKAVLVLMVLPEEAGIEAAGFGQAGLGNHLVDGAVEVLPPGRIGDGAVEAEFHRGLLWVKGPASLAWIAAIRHAGGWKRGLTASARDSGRSCAGAGDRPRAWRPPL